MTPRHPVAGTPVEVPEGMRSGIRGFWYPILRADELERGATCPLRRLGEDLVAWRDSSGEPHVFSDRCPHRSSPLSLGIVRDDRIECRYHGLQFDASGRCRRVPVERADDGPHCEQLRATAHPCEERAGYLWCFVGGDAAASTPPLELEPEVVGPEYEWFLVSATFEANWLTVLENALDPAHVPFLHRDAPFLPNDPEQTLDWFLPDRVVSETKTVPRPSGLGQREVVLQIASRKSAAEEVEEFYPPNLNKIPIPLPDGGEPMMSLHYHTPVDETRTMGYWYMTRRVVSDEERERWRGLWEAFVGPATDRIYEQDVEICEAQTRARRAGTSERLLPQDGGYLRARRRLVELYCREQEQRT